MVGGNPLEKVRRLKFYETEMAYTKKGEIPSLLSALDGISGKAGGARACLATGARWSEAEGLTAKQVRGNGSATTGTRTPKAEWCRLFSEIVWRFGVLFTCGKMPSMSYIRSFVPPKWAVHEGRIYSSKYVSQACTRGSRH